MREGHVSIAMPVRDCASTVGAAIRSIVHQTIDDWDLILIDDGSTDSTLARIRSFSDDRIRVHSDGLSLGLAARLNQAIELAGGDYLARMDGDDIAYPERLERQIAVLKALPRSISWVRACSCSGREAGRWGIDPVPDPRADLRSSPFGLRPCASNMVRPARVVPRPPIRYRRRTVRGPRCPPEELPKESIRQRAGDPRRIP